MGDAIQVVIVTAVAGVALIALVRPYLRKPDNTKAAPPCANCAVSARTPDSRSAAGRRTDP